MALPTTTPDVSQLAQFLPFRRLSVIEQNLLQHVARVIEFHRGQELTVIGDTEGDELFLLTGTVALIARDGGKRVMEAGAANALGAIAQLRPRQFRTLGESQGSVIAVPMAVVDALQRRELAKTTPVAKLELTHDDDDDRLFALMLADLPSQQVKLPVSRAGAASIRSLIAPQNVSVIALAQIALIEPSVSLRLIAAANHPIFFDKPVQSVFEAAIRLGPASTRRLLQVFTAPESVPDRYSTIAQYVQDAVKRAREIAYLCAQLAELTPGLLVARAYEVGLLHAIGEISALAYAETMPEIILDEGRRQACLDKSRSLLGGTLLRSFRLTSDFVMAATSAEEWQRDHQSPVDYADLVILAKLHSAIGTARARQIPAMHTVPAFTKVAGGELNPSRSLAMIKVARAQAESSSAPALRAA